MPNRIQLANLSAKVKAMYAKSLKAEDYEELIKQNSVKEAIILLKTQLPELEGLNDNAHRRELEKALEYMILQDMKKILPYLDERAKEIANYFMKQYEMEAIKKNLTRLFNTPSETIEQVAFSPLIEKLNLVKTIDEFIEVIKNSNYHEIWENYIKDNIAIDTLTIFRIENDIETWYFRSLYEKVKENKEKPLMDIVGRRIDLLNILWVYRAKTYYHIPKSEIKDLLIPISYRLYQEEIIALIEKDDIEEVLSNTIYSHIKKDDIEGRIQQYLYYLYQKHFHTDLFQLSVIVSYIKLREIQVKNLVNVIEGIRYRVPKDKLQKKIIQ